MDLLALLNVRVELRDTTECQLLHQVDAVGLWDMLLAEVLDSDRERGTEEANLVRGIAQVDDFFEDGLELWTESQQDATTNVQY